MEITSKVMIRRWPDNYTLVGPSVMIKDLDEAADLLASNLWVRSWTAAKIREALAAGEVFEYCKRPRDLIDASWRGRDDGIVSEWRLATQEEVLNYADEQQLVAVTGRSSSRDSQGKSYVLHYRDSQATDDAYYALPKQAKVILDLLHAAQRAKFTEASIEVIVTENAALLKTRQEPSKVFAFYRGRFMDEGHLEKLGES